MKWLSFLFVLLISVAVKAADLPQPPCGQSTNPAYASLDAQPNVQVWLQEDLAKAGWTPASCTGWSATQPSNLVIALAGTIHVAGPMDTMIAKVGAISAMRGIRYWSTTQQKWETLIVDAAALSGQDAASRRPDFAPDELKRGGDFNYLEQDNRYGDMIFRMRVLERSENRFVVVTENVSPIRFLFVTLFDPGDIQSVEFFDRTGADTFSVYLTTRVAPGINWLMSGKEKSYINRAVALFRYLGGIPTDQEPPVAR